MSGGPPASRLSAADLERFLRGDPEELGVHLSMVARDVDVAGTRTKLHCHSLAVDANGRVSVARLAEYMRRCVLDYAIPRHRIAEARAHLERHGSTDRLVALHDEAVRLFTHLEQSGEGGELLLFLLAERHLRLPQVLCKMSLKTAREMHYHGADGVYASADGDGVLRLHWGESKVYADPVSAVRSCLASLAPFLAEPEGENATREQDLLLLNEAANLDDPAVLAAFRRYFDRASPMSLRVRYCGVGLVGFDAGCYPSDGAEAMADAIAEVLRGEITGWSDAVGRRILAERLERFDIHFFCLPLPSVDHFRRAFRSALGFSDAAGGTASVAARGRPRPRPRPAHTAKRGDGDPPARTRPGSHRT